MKKMMMAGLCVLLWSGQALAAQVCQSASITPNTPTAGFVDHGNGTVTDTKTGLMWKQCSEGQSGAGCATGTATIHTWQAALQLAETLNGGTGFAGFNDWRVPNIAELRSLVERQCITPAINTVIFPATVGSWYWSASPVAGFPAFIWAIDFNFGYDNGGGAGAKTSSYSVRLVRGGL